MSNIEWTGKTWNPVAGCEAISPGCAHCYAATMTRRLEAMGQADYAGLATAKHFNGKVRCLPHKLDIPLKRKKPTTYFVNSMSDLFHESVPDEFIDKVFAVMELAPQHTFQVLTKRAQRMADYVLRWITEGDDAGEWRNPLPNVWLGVSAEDQQRADERIPWLLKTPAAVRFVSAEPLLGPINFTGQDDGAVWPWAEACAKGEGVDWIIVGGESGGGARPCNVEWIRSIVQQCAAAGVPCFVKQLGANRNSDGVALVSLRQRERGGWRDRKGGDPTEWPSDLRVRQMPGGNHAKI